jgi:beta-glucosidase
MFKRILLAVMSMSLLGAQTHAMIPKALMQSAPSVGQALQGAGAAAVLYAGYKGRQFLRACATRAADYGVYRQESPIKIDDVPPMKKVAAGILQDVNADEFMFGASTSEHQCSKKCTPELCSWSRYAKENNLIQPTDPRYKMDWYTHGETYLDDAQAQLPGFNTVRFSTELALLQPDGPESWDDSVADHYAQRFIAMIKRGITPALCFHHYTDPVWFEDMGGFEKIENTTHFSNACIKLYRHIMQAVKRDPHAPKALEALSTKRAPKWITFNAPDGYAFRGYYAKGGPPGVKSMARTAEVLKNTLEAHVQVYHGIKDAFTELGLDSSLAPQVGFLKNIHQYDPANETWTHWLAKPINNWALGFADQIQHQAVYDFFTKGQYWAQVPPLKVNVKHVNKKAIGATDFVGLNYYSNRYQFFAKKLDIKDESLKTDGETYYHYPQGMYRAIVELHERFLKPLGKSAKREIPMFVAENGIATNDTAKRSRFYHEYLYAIMRAVKDGYKVGGYLPWTFFDNYEWPALENNTERNYGVFAVTDNGKHLQLKEGSAPLKEFGAALPQA